MEKEILFERSDFKKSDYEFFAIVADIGGNNSYFAVIGIKERKDYDIILRNSMQTNEIKEIHEVLNDILFEAKELFEIEVNRCCIGAAGPVSRRRGYITMTNVDIKIDSKTILNNTMLNKVILINDFEAIGFGLDLLDIKKDTIKITKDVTRAKHNTISVIGAGKGLGMTIAPYDRVTHLHTPNPSEGGHIDFAPYDEFEMELVRYVKEHALTHKEIQPEMERILSGSGLELLFDFIKSKNMFEETETAKKIANKKGNEKLQMIDDNYNKDETCTKTIDLFMNFYARAARTIALISECYGGLFITGKIAQHYSNIIKSEKFLNEFKKHDKKSEVLEKIPIYVITNNDIGLYGCCNVAVNFYNIM